MPHKMLHFTDTPRELPPKRPAAHRKQDFEEIYEGFSRKAGEVQASRCSQCGVPFCTMGCPLGNDIPDWLYLTASNRLKEAYQVSSQTNSFPEICGRICPQDRLCEGNCVVRPGFKAVTIGAIERFITENAFEKGWVAPRLPSQERSQSVGIIGAGPAGLACAEKLRAFGYQVSLYDRHPQGGGLLMYGIPGFKLEKSIVKRRLDLLKAQGVHCSFNTEIGAQSGQKPLEELRQTHDALFIATGVYKNRTLSVEGAELKNILPALDYLIAAHAPKEDAHAENACQIEGKNVLIIGGGDTAMDCARSAIRQKAKSVTCLYRRDRDNMPGSAQEVLNAEEEGVCFEFLAAPESFQANEKGDVKEAVFRKMRFATNSHQKESRREIEPTETTFTLPADIVICALGFSPEDLPALWQTDKLHTHKDKRLAVTQHQTSLDGVFAGGDIVRGASLAVWAIKDGRDAAEEIHHYLQNLSTPEKASPQNTVLEGEDSHA
ncbi:NAD(P)-dependent oxidoreductase [Acetobacteraceae bacterium]|nr:NAD(P)-dependent oxidoreductase [Acetobacteraceae bacterium]